MAQQGGMELGTFPHSSFLGEPGRSYLAPSRPSGHKEEVGPPAQGLLSRWPSPGSVNDYLTALTAINTDHKWGPKGSRPGLCPSWWGGSRKCQARPSATQWQTLAPMGLSPLRFHWLDLLSSLLAPANHRQSKWRREGGRLRVRSLFSTQIYDGAQETTVNFSGHQDTQQREGPLVPNLFLGRPKPLTSWQCHCR